VVKKKKHLFFDLFLCEQLSQYFEMENLKREIKGIHIYGCRYNERLNLKTGASTDNTSHIHWVERGTGTPRDRTRLRGEMFESVMDECECVI
jgi:hypothetical protein